MNTFSYTYLLEEEFAPPALAAALSLWLLIWLLICVTIVRKSITYQGLDVRVWSRISGINWKRKKKVTAVLQQQSEKLARMIAIGARWTQFFQSSVNERAQLAKNWMMIWLIFVALLFLIFFSSSRGNAKRRVVHYFSRFLSQHGIRWPVTFWLLMFRPCCTNVFQNHYIINTHVRTDIFL